VIDSGRLASSEVQRPVNHSVRLLIIATVAAASIVFAAALPVYPTRETIGGPVGLLFWIALTLAASTLPVRLPRGTLVSVANAPVLAAIALGGPVAGGIVALIGSTEVRELRRQIPWYGTLFNHASILLSAVAAGVVYEVLTSGWGAGGFLGFAALMIAASVLYLINGALATGAISVRTQTPFRLIWAQDLGAVGLSWIGLAPLGWMMTQVFLLEGNAGWWATPLFFIPLLATRQAYHRYVETRELFEQTIRALAMAVDARDPNTKFHSVRVQRIAGAMAREMKQGEQMVEEIEWAGLLHDIGKIGIRDHILLKEGPLDRDERLLMNQHPRIGYDIVKPVARLENEAPLIWAHHEWFNGSGYPEGKEALNIPLGARILTVADAYEAMTAPRPYRKTPLSHEIAVAELEKYAGIQFDPEIVPVLVNLDREILDPTPGEQRGLDEILSVQRKAATTSLPRQAGGTPHDETGEEARGIGGQTGTRRRLASDDVS
jgi:putative nucleotidyltransferase with HDIG domain